MTTATIGNEITLATSQADRDEIFRLRYGIYVDEMRYDYPTADHARRLLSDRLDPTARLLRATAEGETAGTLRMHLGKDGPLDREFVETYETERFRGAVPESAMSVLTRFMIKPEHRGGSFAHDLIRRLIELNVEEGVELLFLDCLPHLVNYYTGLGWRPSGRPYNDPVSGILVTMVLVLGDHAHLERLRSPLLDLCRRKPRTPVTERALGLLPALPRIRSEVTDHDEYLTEASGLLGGLGTQGVLDGLTDETKRTLLQRSHILQLGAGDHVIKKNIMTQTVFVVLDGTLEVLEGDKPIAFIRPGDVVGEVAFLLACKRTRDVRVTAPGARVLALNEKALRTLIDSDSRGAALLLLNLSKALAAKLAKGASPLRTSARLA